MVLDTIPHSSELLELTLDVVFIEEEGFMITQVIIFGNHKVLTKASY